MIYGNLKWNQNEIKNKMKQKWAPEMSKQSNNIHCKKTKFKENAKTINPV